ncbi:hypothetical protein GCM10009630_49200 [Kribbella jejuensis]|uniref:GreA/GreB family transcription elongation factor n=1 Tax=Kribbella jejuensis TaxID=236068 RepID=A0A542E7R3_9ACTN|nr:hypothetical protein [Kribbella jejuensis]TQJ11309.1 hypothetical protein FB475_4220 [Kribbella jejuensis]
MDSNAKLRVKDALLAHLEAHLRATGAAVDREDSAARLDQDTVFAPDERSQSDEAADLGSLFEHVEERQHGTVALAEQLDFGPTDEVGPGAIVVLDDNHYVVGVASSPFESDGVTYEGMTTDAPLYKAIKGLHPGDTFTFNTTEHHITAVD